MKEDTKTQKKESPKGLKMVKAIFNTVINILIVMVLIVSIVIAVMALSSRANGLSTIFGYTIQTIESDSMKGGSPDGYPEGDFGNGDLMIAKAVNGDIDIEFDVGDIVTFIEKDTDGNDAYIVHRIVDRVEREDGNYLYQTQGDNRDMAEVPDQRDVSEYLIKGQFVSVYYTDTYTGKIIKGVGGFLDYLRSQQGFFFVVLLPMILFFIYEVIRVVMNMTNYRKAKAQEEQEEAVKAAVADALAGKELDDDAAAFEKMTPEQREQFKQFMAQQNQDETSEAVETEAVETIETNEDSDAAEKIEAEAESAEEE